MTGENDAVQIPVHEIVTPTTAYYQMSVDNGYCTVEMPFILSVDDAEDVISNMNLIIRQIRRRASQAASAVDDQELSV